MQIPVKITPDRIRDSIVQVFFQSSVPSEALVGIFYQSLTKSGWKYANRPNETVPSKGLVIEFVNNTQHFFLKDEVRFQLHGNHSIAFNCNRNYIGWEQYSVYIKEVLNDIFESGIITSFVRIGIRYISEFPDIDILEKLKFRISIPDSENISNSSYRLAFDEGNIMKTVNIASKLPARTSFINQNREINYISMLDIDVVKKSISVTNLKELWSEIDELHRAEKEMFFNLLDPDFLITLNPQYA